jgi:purine-binding chemotaxis protein CheW
MEGGTPSLVCRAGFLLCAFPLGQVREVMRGQPIEALAGSPPFVLGLSVIRGLPLPAVDVGMLLGGHRSPTGWMVSVRLVDRAAALVVDRVMGVHTFPAEQTAAMPPLLSDAAADIVSAIGTLDSELLLFLNVARSIPEDLISPAGEETP